MSASTLSQEQTELQNADALVEKKNDAVTSQKIFLNASGGYDLDLNAISNISKIVLFDGEKKVAEIHRHHGVIKVDIIADKVVNISANDPATSLSIKSSGKICFQNKLNVNRLNVDAKDIAAECAVEINDNARIVAKNEIVVAQDFFCGGKLKLESQSCTLNGHTTVFEGCSIKTKRLDVANEVQWQGCHSIETDEWYCYEGAKVNIEHSEAGKQSQITINKAFSTVNASSFYLGTSDQITQLLKNKQLHQSPVVLTAKNMSVNGECHLQDVKLSGDQLTAKKKAKLTIERSHLSLQESRFDGAVECNDSLLESTCIINMTDQASTKYQRSHVKATDVIYDGHVTVKDTCMDAKSIRCAEKSSVSYDHSYVKASEFIASGKHTLKESIFESTERMEWGGSVDVDNIAIKGKKVVLRPTALTGSKINVDADSLLLKADKDKKTQFNKLVAKAGIFETWGHIHLNSSQVISESDKVSENLGTLELTDSPVIIKGQFYNGKDATLKVQQTKADAKSGIQANRFYNAGDATFDNTVLAADIIAHVGKSFAAIKSAVFVENNLFVDDHAQMTLSEQSHLQGQKAKMTVSGQVSVEKGSDFNLNQMTSLPTAEIALDHAQGNVDEQLILGKSKIGESTLTAKRTTILGELNAASSTVAAEETDVLGTMAADHSKLQMGEHMKVRPHGKMFLTESTAIGAEMEHQGYLRVKKDPQKTSESKQPAKDSPTTSTKPTPTLKLKRFYSSFGSVIEGDDLILEADAWHHQGNLELTGNLHARGVSQGSSLLNEGGIKAKTADIGYDTLTNLYGMMSAEHLKIKAGVSVNLGVMHAQTLENSSFVNLNAGLVSAYNLQNNSVFAADFGLTLPSIPSDYKQIFSVSNILRTAKVAGGALLPGYSSAINFVSAIPGMYSTAKSAWDYGREFSLEKLSDAPWYELADHACKVTNFAVSATNFVGQAKAMTKDINAYFQQRSKKKEAVSEIQFEPVELKHKKKSAWDTVMNGAAGGLKIATTVFGPTQSTQAVFSLNQGVKLSNNISESTLFSYNGGWQAATDSITSNAWYQYNNGSMQARNSVNLSGYSLVNNGTVTGGEGVSVNYKHVSLTRDSQHDYHHWNIRGADTVSIQGMHTFSHSKISTQELKTEKLADRAQVTFNQGSEVSAKLANLAEDVKVNGSSFVCDDLNQTEKLTVQNGGVLVAKQHRLEKTGHLQVEKSRHETERFTSAGTSEYSQSLQKGKEIVYEESARDKKTETDVEALSIKVDGKQEEKHVSVKTDKYVLTSSSETHKEQTRVDAREAELDGDMHHDQAAVVAKEKLSLANGSRLHSRDSYYENQTGGIHNGSQGTYAGGNTLKAQQTVELDRSASMQGSGSVVFDAERLVTNGASVSVAAAQLNVRHIGNPLDAIKARGEFENFKPTEAVGVKTETQIVIDEKIDDTRHISLEGKAIHVKETVTTTSSLELKSNEAGIQVDADVTGRNTFVESARGVEANAATIQGTNHVSVIAKGDINLNDRQELTHDKRNRVIGVKHIRSQILGGKGDGTDGVGVYMKADGRINGKACIVASEGDNVVHGNKGINFSHDYRTVRSHHVKEGFWKTSITSTAHTEIARSSVTSSGGRNIFISEDGGFNATATDFFAVQGNFARVKDDIRLREAIGIHEVYKDTDYIGGIINTRSHTKDEFAEGVRLFDLKNSSFESLNGSIYGTGVNVSSPGKFSVIATQGEIKFGVAKLNHTHTHESRGLFVGGTTADLLKAMAAKPAVDTLVQMDPTLRDVQQGLSKHSDNLEQLLTTTNAMRSTYDAYQQVQQSGIGNTLLTHAGLGDAQGFNPRATLGVKHQKNRAEFQSASQSQFAVGELELIADPQKTAELEGVRLQIEKNMRVKGKRFVYKGVSLRSSFKDKETHVAIGANLAGTVDVGISQTKNKVEAETYEYAHGYVGGALELDVDQLKVDAGKLSANELRGRADQIEVITRQNTTQQRSTTVNVQSTGAISASETISSEKVAAETSQLHIHKSIDDQFKTNEVHLVGGSITSEGQNNISAEKIHAEKVVDEKHSETRGFSGNITDFIPGPQENSSKENSTMSAENASSSTLPVIKNLVSVTIGHEDQVVEHLPTIAGNAGTAIHAQQVVGELNETMDSTRVVKDEKQHLDIRVPNLAPLLKSSTPAQPTEIVIPEEHPINMSSLPKNKDEDLPASSEEKINPEDLMLGNPTWDDFSEQSYVPESILIPGKLDPTSEAMLDMTLDCRDSRWSPAFFSADLRASDSKQARYFADKIDLEKIDDVVSALEILKECKQKIDVKNTEEFLSFRKGMNALADKPGWNLPKKINAREAEKIAPSIAAEHFEEYWKGQLKGLKPTEAQAKIEKSLSSARKLTRFGYGLTAYSLVSDGLSTYQVSRQQAAQADREMDVSDYASVVAQVGIEYHVSSGLTGVCTAAAFALTKEPYSSIVIGNATSNVIMENLWDPAVDAVTVELPKHHAREFKLTMEQPFYKDTLIGLEKAIEETQRETPTNWWGSMCKEYKLQSYEESKDRQLENIGNAAMGQALWSFLKK